MLKSKRKVNERYRYENNPRWIPREKRVCKCGCNLTFECKKNSERNFVNGHNRRNINLSEDTKNKIGKANKGRILSEESKKKMRDAAKLNKRTKEKHPLWIPREERICKCGCNEAFICLQNSKQKYVHGHHRKNQISFHRKRTKNEVEKISTKMKSKGYKNKTLQQRFNWTDERYNKYLIKRREITLRCYELNKFQFQNTKPHRILYKKMIDEGLWNEDWKNEFIFDNFLAIDVANKKLKIAIFVDGDYWHANPTRYLPDFVICSKSAKQIWNKDKWVSNKVKNQGWIVLRFWENEILKKIENCIKKIKAAIDERQSSGNHH